MSNFIDDIWNSVVVPQTRAGTGVPVKTKKYQEYEKGKCSLDNLEQPFTNKWGNEVAGYNHEEYIKKSKMKRGDFVRIKESAITSLIMPYHRTTKAEKERQRDLVEYAYIGLVCKINDYNPNAIVVCLSFDAEIHWYSIEDVEQI